MRAPPWRVERHARLPSTQSLVAQRAAAGEAGGLAILADRQEGGRGRAGRAWVSAPGNLHLSVLLRPDAPASALPGMALLAGVALHQAASREAEVRLRWPNDLMRGEAKAAGILAEAQTDSGRIAHLILGFGVNLALAPALPDRATAALGAVPPERFAHALLAALGSWLDRHAAEGLAPVLRAWMEAGPAPGTPLAIRQGDRLVEGRYHGLAADGALLLAQEGITHRILAGEAE